MKVVRCVAVAFMAGAGLAALADCTADIGLAETTNLVVSAGSTETWSGVVSGPGGIILSGGGTLVLANGANGFAGGVEIRQGVVKAVAEGCLGTGPLSTTGKSAPCQFHFAAEGATFANAMTFGGFADSTQMTSPAVLVTASTTFDGPVTLEADKAVVIGTASTDAGKWSVVFRRPVTAKDHLLGLKTWGDYTFEQALTCGTLFIGNVYSANRHVHLHSPDNEIGIIRYNSTTVVCETNDVLGGACLRVEQSWSNRKYSLVELGGHDQTVASLEFNTGMGKTYWPTNGQDGCRISSTGQVAKLTLVGESKSRSTLQLVDENVALELNAAAFPGFEQTLRYRTHTTRQPLRVTAGTLRLTDGSAFPSVPSVFVGEAGTLALEGCTNAFAGCRALEVEGTFAVAEGLSAGFGDRLGAVTVGRDASVDLGTAPVAVCSLVVDGVGYPPGRYTSAEIPQLKGATAITVTAATWTGAAAPDTAIGNGANWDTTPVDLVSGGLSATFASGGAVATVSEPVRLLDVTLAAAEGTGGFTFARGGERARVRLGGSSLTAVAGEKARDYVFEVPVELAGGHSRVLTVPEADSLRFGDGLVCDGSVDVRGDGRIVLSGESVIAGSFKRTAGTSQTVVSGLLATPGHVDQGAAAANGPACLSFRSFSGTGNTVQGLVVSNAVVEKPLYLDAAIGTYLLHALAGTTNVVRGNVLQGNAWSGVSLQTGSELVLEGGYVSTYAAFRPTGTGHLVVRGTPIDTAKSLGFSPSGSGHYTFAVAGNRISYLAAYIDALSTTFEFTVSDVFAASVPTVLLPGLYWSGNAGGFRPYSRKAAALVEFHSTTQRVATLAGGPYARLRGDDGSLLVLTGPQGGAVGSNLPAANNYFASPVEGGLSLRMEGTGTLLVTNGVSGTRGRLEVASGEVHLAHDAAWPNVSEVVVSGSGRLKFDASSLSVRGDAVNPAATWRLSGGAVVELPAGRVLHVGRLFVDGVEIPCGTYSDDNMPEAVRPHFPAGTPLEVRKRPTRGFLLVIGGAPKNPPEPLVLTAEDLEVAVAERGDAVSQFAGVELTNFLAQAFGRTIPLVRHVNPAKKTIVLGVNDWSRMEGLDVSGLPRDGFLRCVRGNRVYLLGADDPEKDPAVSVSDYRRATLFAVYDFLERFADARFFFPGELGTVIPRVEALTVPVEDRMTAPAYSERYYGSFYAYGTWCGRAYDWRTHELAKLRMRYGTYDIPCCHGQQFFRYVRRFAQEHPDWFCLQENGERYLVDTETSPYYKNAKHCYTSPIVEEMYHDVKAYLTGQPASSRGLDAWGTNCKDRYVDIMPQDGFMKCWCPNCLAAYNEGDQYATDLIWGMTADIARRLTAEGVEGTVTQMAYSPYRSVPNVDIPRNVEVMVAEKGPWSLCDTQEFRREVDEIRAWCEKLGRKVWLWTYPGKYNGANPGIPQISPRAYAAFFKAVTPWIFGGYVETESDRFAYDLLNLYVYSRLCWNPSVDVEAVIADYHEKLFGAAAAPMKRAFDLLEEKWVYGVCDVSGTVMDDAPVQATVGAGDLWSKIYTRETVAALERDFDAAAAAVPADSREGKCVALMRSEIFAPLKTESDAHDVALELQRRAARADASVLPGGEFDASLEGWRVPTSGGYRDSRATIDAAEKISGVASVRLETSPEIIKEYGRASLYRTLDLEPGRAYRLSFFMKTKDVVPHTEGGGACCSVSSTGSDTSLSLKVPTEIQQGTCDWLHYSAEFVAPPTGKVTFNFLIIRSTGTIWIDGARVEPVEESRLG